MAAINFKTGNNTFRKLIGNGLTYRIPRFQRDYSWTNEEWEDLWMDPLGTLESGASRDLGSAEYEQKRPSYQRSGFAITRKLGNDNAEWKPDRIAAVQHWMANQAAAIWRIAQLS